MFINHLETEFSCENLLFITEYVQVKHCLKKKYGMLEDLIKKNPCMRYDISLPDMDLKNSDMVIPTSLIAKKVLLDGNAIVAFKSLYKKYIDGNNAPFMINIASRTRQVLINLLDADYYFFHLQPNRSPASSLSMLQYRLSVFTGSTSRRETGTRTRALIDVEFEAHKKSIPCKATI